MPPTMSNKSVLQRLQVKPGRKLAAVGVPAEVKPLLVDLPEGSVSTSRVSGDSDVVLVFVEDQADLQRRLPKVVTSLRPSMILWVAYPKLSGPVKSDLSRDTLYPQVAELGWTPIQQISIDDTWSALRFKPAS